MTDHGLQGEQLEESMARRDALAAQYLKASNARPATSARGIHHVALISSDVEQTIRFYDGLLGFPLVEMLENLDYRSGTSLYFLGPDGERLELISDPLGWMYGNSIG